MANKCQKAWPIVVSHAHKKQDELRTNFRSIRLLSIFIVHFVILVTYIHVDRNTAGQHAATSNRHESTQEHQQQNIKYKKNPVFVISLYKSGNYASATRQHQHALQGGQLLDEWADVDRLADRQAWLGR